MKRVTEVPETHTIRFPRATIPPCVKPTDRLILSEKVVVPFRGKALVVECSAPRSVYVHNVLINGQKQFPLDNICVANLSEDDEFPFKTAAPHSWIELVFTNKNGSSHEVFPSLVGTVLAPVRPPPRTATWIQMPTEAGFWYRLEKGTNMCAVYQIEKLPGYDSKYLWFKYGE